MESARGGWILYRLMRKVVEEMLRMKVSMCILTALKENQKILNAISGRLNIPPFYPIASYRVFHIIPFMKYRNVVKYKVEKLSSSDFEEMTELFRKYYNKYELVEEFGRERIEQLLEQSNNFSLDNFLVAKFNERIVSVLSYWDQSSFKKTVVQKYRGFLKGFYYILRPLGVLPSEGNPLKILNVRHLAYEDGFLDAAKELLKYMIMLSRPRYRLFQVGFHERSPLIRAIKGFPKIGMNIVLFAAFKDENPTLVDRLQNALVWEDMTLH